MDPRYSGVISRTLTAAERRVPTNEDETPLVIEPLESSNAAFLRNFLGCYSSQLLNDLAKHGALLLRGFDVESPCDFERYILSIRGMCGMNEILLSEPGRTTVEGTRFVFYTNTLVKTGGTLMFGTFHTENYPLPDVPRYVSFLCETPSKLGGETGLVNMAKVYADLSDTLRRKLEERTCLVSLHSISEMVRRYELNAGIIHEFCRAAGLPVVTIDGVQYVAIYKPSVVQHPLTHERALLVALGYISPIQKPVLDAFLTDYAGPRWLMHRLFWKAPWLAFVGARMSYGRLHQPGAIYVTKMPPPVSDARPLTAIFSHEEVRILAAIIRHRFSSFLWKQGDILILDNLKVAHNGMAGLGKRELKVIMCNPVPLPSSSTSPGLHVVPHSYDPRECLGAQLVRLRHRPGSSGAFLQSYTEEQPGRLD